MIGSFCFAIASVPAIAELIPGWPIATVYFIGSLFFTSAGFLQLRASHDLPSLIASGIQFIGTILFNISTAGAFLDQLEPLGQDLVIWTPDVWGSIAFLLSSLIAQVVALRDVSRGVGTAAAHRRNASHWPTPLERLGHAARFRFHKAVHDLRSDEVWIASINLSGSIAFGLSAIAAFVVPNTGELLDATAVNTWTLIGALCFLIAAFLLVDEQEPEAPAAAPVTA